MYYTFPAFARLALTKKPDAAAADEVSSVQTEEIAGTQIESAEQSGKKRPRETIKKLDVARKSGGD